MKDNKKIFQTYTVVWVAFFLVLVATLFRMYGDEHIINYTGIIRGCTQKVVLGETQGVEDDELIDYVNQVIDDLQSGTGEYNSFGVHDNYFQEQLIYIEDLWNQIKEEIIVIRTTGSSESIYSLSLSHYEVADDLVHYVEDTSEEELNEFFHLFGIAFGCAILLLIYLFHHNRKNLEKAMMYDGLTNIYSRDGFLKKSNQFLRNSSAEKYVVLAIDIVHFRVYNHRLGYDFGDDILIMVANFLQDFTREDGICSRITGDNFKILIKNRDHLMTDLNTYILEALQANGFSLLVKDIHFRFSGYEITDNTEDIEGILGKVNLVHSYAKAVDAKDALWYDESFVNNMHQEDMYTSHLNEALLKKEFKMYLQPQINLETMEVTSAEALVRWEVGDGKIIYPDHFISLYEGKGLIPLLDYYILEEACSYLHDHNFDYLDFGIAINFSRVTLSSDQFISSFLAIIQKYEIEPSQIEVEITETSLNELSDEVINKLDVLSKKGFKIAMDDFGAGFSNLCSLSSIPLNVLKLDKQFLWKMDTSGNMPEIIESIVKMAHNLGLEVVCEGVESNIHMEFLRNVGCDIGQGYYISRAIPVNDFTQKYMYNKK